MNWFTNFFKSLVSRGHAEIKKLTQLDGKPGLGIGDIEMIAAQLRKLATVDAAGSEKHRMAVAWLVERFGERIPRGYAEVIIYITYNLIKSSIVKKL